MMKNYEHNTCVMEQPPVTCPFCGMRTDADFVKQGVFRYYCGLQLVVHTIGVSFGRQLYSGAVATKSSIAKHRKKQSIEFQVRISNKCANTPHGKDEADCIEMGIL